MYVNSLSEFIAQPSAHHFFYNESEVAKASSLHEHIDQAFLHELKEALNKIGTSCVALFTSGSTGQAKIVVLTRKALETSALTINRTFALSSKDIWLCALPVHHIGGLSIYERARLSKSTVIAFTGNTYKDAKIAPSPKIASWSAQLFYDELLRTKATWTSLVPTQLHDLVQRQRFSPKSLRGVFVGGGQLERNLHDRAHKLGWPVHASYGMTECASQIATNISSAWSPFLSSLPHVTVKANAEGRLMLQSRSLFSAYLLWDGDNKSFTLSQPFDQEGWFTTEDLAEVDCTAAGPRVQPLGRADQQVKVKGELVSLQKVTECISRVREKEIGLSNQTNEQNWLVLNLPHSRLENELVIAIESADTAPAVIGQWQITIESANVSLPEYQHIRRILVAPTFPRTALGKIQRELLRKTLRETLCETLPNTCPQAGKDQ